MACEVKNKGDQFQLFEQSSKNSFLNTYPVGYPVACSLKSKTDQVQSLTDFIFSK